MQERAAAGSRTWDDTIYFDSSNVPTPFRVDSAAKLLPKFMVEHEIETYFVMLEKITRTNE